MPYARFDDRWDDHKKIKRALRREPAAVAMHAMLITYCNRHNSDGEVDAAWVEERLAMMPYKAAQRQRILDLLLELQMLERVDDETFLVHDFLDWNLSREQRAKFAEQGRRGGNARRGLSHSPSQGSSQGLSEGLSQSGDGGLSTPLATPLATPTPRHSTPVDPRIRALCERLGDHIRRNDSKTTAKPESDAWQRDMRLLVEDRDGDYGEVGRIIDWCQTDSFWRSNILSPAKLRKQFTQLLLRADAPHLVAPAGSELDRKRLESANRLMNGGNVA